MGHTRAASDVGRSGGGGRRPRNPTPCHRVTVPDFSRPCWEGIAARPAKQHERRLSQRVWHERRRLVGSSSAVEPSPRPEVALVWGTLSPVSWRTDGVSCTRPLKPQVSAKGLWSPMSTPRMHHRRQRARARSPPHLPSLSPVLSIVVFVELCGWSFLWRRLSVACRRGQGRVVRTTAGRHSSQRRLGPIPARIELS